MKNFLLMYGDMMNVKIEINGEEYDDVSEVMNFIIDRLEDRDKFERVNSGMFTTKDAEGNYNAEVEVKVDGE